MSSYNDDDVVISGISGHYPASENPQELMENLFNGVDMTSADHNKWEKGERNVPQKVGSMLNSNRFDAQFFGIIRKQANSLDPVTRQILERTLEAIFDAGLNPLDLKGSNTGVFISCAILETEMFLVLSGNEEAYGIMGRTRALNANRLSYWLDLKGPSMATDCFFNGGCQAIQEAYRYFESGIIDAAIVGSGATIIHSNSSHQYNTMKLLCPDGNTRSFDINANGYARSEAVSVILLQRARDAKRCHATIVHAMNQSMCDNNGIYFEPNQESWKKMYEKFYSDCKINPKDVEYLEADGTAIPVMEEAELNAAAEFFCKDRTKDNPLLIGSVKSNLGHAEGAANMCSLAKLIIALEYEKIPKNLHFKAPNPNIKGLVRGTMKVVDEDTPLKGELVAMNSFSFSSSYGHLLLRKNMRKKCTKEFQEGSLPHILLLSSRNEEGINLILDKVEAQKFDPEYTRLVNNAFRRMMPGHMYRGFTTLPIQEPPIRESRHFAGDEPPVWFVYSGMGSQWATMARDLLHLPVFRKSIETSAKVLSAHDVDLLHILTHDDPSLFDSILHSFICIVSVQIALTDVLKSIGIEPNGIIGHSVGETTASYADGCLTHEQTILSAYFRGRASIETKVIPGMMAAVGIGYQQMKNKVPDGIEIACHNGPDSCTLSGPVDQVNDYVNQLKSEGVFAKVVNVSNTPYHSRYIKDMGPPMLNYLKHVIPEGRERSSRWVSTSIPESRWGEPGAKICNAEYHINNLLSPVLFEEGTRLIPENAILIEIAPHGLLQAILKRSLPTCVNIPLANRNVKNQQHVLLKAIGTMFLNGLDPKVEKLYPEVTYPVSRGTSFISPLVTWDHSDVWSNYNSAITSQNSLCTTITLQHDQDDGILSYYKQDGVYVLPHCVYLPEIWKIYAASLGKAVEEVPVEFKDVHFYNNNQIHQQQDVTLSVGIQPGKGSFEVLRVNEGNEELLAKGTIQLLEKVPTSEEIVFEAKNEMSKEEFYAELLHNGHAFDEQHQIVTKLTIGEHAWKANVCWKNNIVRLLDTMLQIRTLLAGDKGNKMQRIQKIRQLIIDTSDLASEEVSVDLSLAPDVIRCGKVEIRDVIFESIPRNPIIFEKEELNSTELTLPLPTETLQVDYLQYNGTEIGGLQVAYVGSDNSGKKIMGIGVVDEVSGSIQEDGVLKWQIPATWSAEDAISVPFNYGLAYYIVNIIGEITPNKSVAVTDGTNKLGLAFLTVLLEITTDVVTLVSDEGEKQQLKMLLPKLPDANILVNSKLNGQHVCMKIKSRCPKGVNVLINTGAPDIIEPALLCVKPFSTIIELTDEKFKTLRKLNNTQGYLISTSLYNCSGNELLLASEEVKNQVHQLLVNGINLGVVKPFKETHMKDWRQIKTIKFNSESRGTNSRYQCDPEKAYLILGGDSHTWLSIAEWFIQRKAKNILVVHQDIGPANKGLQERLKHLEEKCKMVVKPAKTLSPELIDHIFAVSRAKIDLTVFIPDKIDDQSEESVVQALCQKETFLITILRSQSNALKYCKERNPSLPTLTVLLDTPLSGKAKSLLEVLDRLLINHKNQIVVVNKEKEEGFSGDYLYDTIFPNSLEEVLANSVAPTGVQVTEIITNSVGYQQSKEVTPIFVFPGLVNRNVLIERFRESLYPVFIVDLPSLDSASISNYAASAVPKIKSLIQDKKGPFTVLGENWGGAVALEVARMLENTGEKMQVFLIGGSPSELANHQWTTIHDLDTTLIERVFGNNIKLPSETSWNERLTLNLGNVSTKETIIRQSLSTIREKAKTLLAVQKREPINGTVVCISRQYIPRAERKWMSRKEVSLIVVPKSEPLLNDTVFEYIHDNVAIKFI